MDTSASEHFDFELILLAAIEGEATAEQRAWLNESLLQNPELRKQASRFLCDESLLADEIGASEQVLSITTRAIQQRERMTLEGPHGKSLPRTAMDAVNRHGLVVALAASFVVIALALQNRTMLKQLDRLHSVAVVEPDPMGPGALPKSEGSPENANSARAIEVGRIAGLRGAVWEPGEPALRFGDAVVQGQVLRLSEGVVELLMTTGAKVTIEGPAIFEAASPAETNLAIGKIAAAVPRTARGYTVMTPTSELVDIGTQFGVSVELSGDTELHVFDGDVVARSLAGSGSANLVHAKQSEAMRFVSSSSVPSRFAARAEDFVRHIEPVSNQSGLPELPRTKDLALWYTASTIRDAKPGDAVSTWRDLLVGDNHFPDDAFQFDPRRCPRYVVDEKGVPALRFDGWSTSLATGPMEGADKRTVIVVCSPGPASFSSEYHGGIVYKYGDSPSLEFTVLRDYSARGWVWPGADSPKNVGVVQSGELAPDTVTALAYQYDSQASRSALWVNGVMHGESSAPVKLSGCAQSYIGSHHSDEYRAKFFGLIYEVIVYDTMLEQETMDRFSRYFEGRYSISSLAKSR